MKTVGEILKKARIEKHITLEEAEKNLKIRKKFLQALEENNWNKLPSLPYIKGFLKNYSRLLGLNSEQILAIFRREYPFNKQKNELLPKGLSQPLDEPLVKITPQVTVFLLVFIFLIFFFGYIGLQYKAYIDPPSLSVEKPLEGEILYSQKLEILGKTDKDSVLSINGKKVAIENDGTFKTYLSLTPGINQIIIESTSKFGKKRTIIRTVQFEENNNNK